VTTPQISSEPKVRFGQPSRPLGSGPAFGLAGALGGILVVAVVLGGLIWSAAAGSTSRADHPGLFAGNLVLEDYRPLTVIDLATAKITIRLEGLAAQVGATDDSDIQTVPVDGGTMLVDRRTGTFNFLEKDNYVLDANGSGVGLGSLDGSTGAEGLAAGPDAYIIRSGPQSTVSLVSQATVATAAKLESAPGATGSVPAKGPVTAAPAEAISPPGFSALPGSVALAPGSAAVEGPDLWVLDETGRGCVVDQLHPVPSGHGLVSTNQITEPGDCSRDALETAAGVVGLMTPGSARLFLPPEGQKPSKVLTVSVPVTAQDSQFLPITSPAGQLQYLAKGSSGWSLINVDPTGRVSGPYRLNQLGVNASPSAPAYSNGFLYTLDEAQAGQPILWAIDADTGNMAPVPGVSTYPALNRTEEAPFFGTQVIAVGPRVVFNNPQSLEAVVVFTDGTRVPAVIDKRLALAVTATGPADLNTSSGSGRPNGNRRSNNAPAPRPGTAVQPISQQVSCASTTQKPYAPQITSVTPTSGSALVAWSYQLLDQTDCEPDSWSVTMTALTGSHQPAQPTQVENGQNQYDFTGLRPATTYRAMVTAYINAQSTTSAPATFTTSPRGPDPPTAVHTTADANGDWIVSWTPCDETTHPNCVVPADNWTVTGAACGSSFVGQPPTIEVPASQTSVTIASDQLGLLGDSLSFSVEGSLVSGLSGSPISDGACTQAWRAPNASAIRLAASGTAAGSTITATLAVSPTASTEVYGSQTTEFIYSAGGITVGPTTQTSATITGLAAGVVYTPTVTVYPADHPTARVTVTGNTFSQNIKWPSVGVAINPSVDPANPNIGTIVISFPGAPTAQLSESGGSIQCGGAGGATLGIAPGALVNDSVTVSNFDLDGMGGSCMVQGVALTDTSSPNPYGTPDLLPPTGFAIGQQPSYTFSATASTQCSGPDCQVVVAYVPCTAGQPGCLPGPAPQAGDTWQVTMTGGPDGCDASWGPSATPDFPVSLPAQSKCDLSGLNVTVSYRYLGTNRQVPVGAPSGSFPTTTTTAPTTTLPPCPSTTTSSTDARSTTTSTTAPCAQGGSSAALGSGRTSSRAADPVIRDALGGALVGFPILWLVGGARKLVRKRRRSSLTRAARYTEMGIDEH
jgi:Fibronectin type III domain